MYTGGKYTPGRNIFPNNFRSVRNVLVNEKKRTPVVVGICARQR